MQILKEKQALRELIQSFKKEGLIVGLVPTMGALHQGHLSLVEHALAECDKVVVSIFVNPTQFDNSNDLETYPRNLENDVTSLSTVSNELIIFNPAASEIYENGVLSKHFTFGGLEHHMEGKYRKGHFDGVGTVVKKLLEIVSPTKAFFGEKDFQQLQIIRHLVHQYQLNIAIVGCPIEREASGLARSSRNEKLSPKQRENAGFIYQVLLQVKEQFGTKNASDISDWVKARFEENKALRLEYFEIANSTTLNGVEQQNMEGGEKYRAFIAAYSGEIRLIDNLALN